MDERRATIEHLADRVDMAGDGVQWTLGAMSDLNANLVHLDAGSSMARHVNAEVDVLMVVLAGDGILDIEGRESTLLPHTVAHVPRGAARAIAAGRSGLAYVTVHRRRGPLQMTARQSFTGGAQ
jgi:quercetin dioxygenase-like cupin family protein